MFVFAVGWIPTAPVALLTSDTTLFFTFVPTFFTTVTPYSSLEERRQATTIDLLNLSSVSGIPEGKSRLIDSLMHERHLCLAVSINRWFSEITFCILAA